MCLPRLHVTLRRLMIAVVAVAIAIGSYEGRARRKRRAVQWVQAQGGRVVYLDQLDEAGEIRKGARPAGPEWARRLLGEEYVRSVAWVDLSRASRPVPPEGLSHLCDLPDLRYLRLEGPAVDDRHMAWIGRLSVLEDLDLGGGVTDSGLTHLSRLGGLKTLVLSNSRVTRAGLDGLLCRLPHLKTLGLHYANLYGEDVARLEREHPGLVVMASW